MSAIRQTLRAALALGMPRRWLLVKNPASSGSVCLTFDDGPHPEHTPRLLDVLREQGVTATFFVIGEQAEKHPQLVRRMAAEGHAVGQHSYFHTEPAATPTRQLMQEILRTTKLLEDIVGQPCPLFRPPKGELTVGKMIALRRAGMNIVLWNADPKDYKCESVEALAAWFAARPLKAGDIVLMHDVKPFAAGVIAPLAGAARAPGCALLTPCPWKKFVLPAMLPRFRRRTLLSQTLPIIAEQDADRGREAARPAPPRRVLFISYVFPPVGGAGVQRTAKFVKYLPAQGWQPSVLTVQNPSVPAFDASLLADIPQDVLIRRARTLEPSYAVKHSVSAGEAKSNSQQRRKPGRLKGAIKSVVRGAVKLVLQPDPQVLWAPAALREGGAFLREHRPDVILVSGPPFSSFLIGARLARRTGIPLVLDYRDEWDISNAYLENKRLDPASLWLQRRMQHYAVRSAAALIATTQSSAVALTKIRDLCRSKASVHCIYNGYDPKDFPPANALRRISRERFRLAYVGTLWNLTSIEPVVKAIELVSQRSPALARKLELVVVGRRTEPQQQLLARLKNLPCALVEHPYLPHDEALQLVRDADGLCVLLSDVAGAERVVPAKLFEYMAARRAIFCIAPKGEMWDLLAAHPAAHRHEPRDVEAIAASIEKDVAAFCAEGSASRCEFDAIEHSRPYEAGQMARLLESLVRQRNGGGVYTP